MPPTGLGDCSACQSAQYSALFPEIVNNCDRLRKPGIVVKVEFYVWLISSTIELTRDQVSDQLCASLWRYSALLAIAPHPQ